MDKKNKYVNKERFSHRGPKKRYSVFKAEGNAFWSEFHKNVCEQRCKDYGLNIEDYVPMDEEERYRWIIGYHNLQDAGYKSWSKSLQQHYFEMEKKGHKYLT